ncbi:PIN domain-containing protein [Ruficoccus amylovorans]|uniref:PIN domain-containing protein n=1 Tax=Ruficoccus amylovorans TaxID=1804625 RepID=A0A842HHI7_9BACT|nr:PIN domain-containing protein [Ruficoccus amylovorans]
MKLFLDSSVLLSASASAKGASRYIVENAESLSWSLISSAYCLAETQKNLPKLGPAAVQHFKRLVRDSIAWTGDALSPDKILIFPKAKDRPVVLSALAAKVDVLLTLDRQDFMGLLGSQVYGVAIRTPGDWLLECREHGVI